MPEPAERALALEYSPPPPSLQCPHPELPFSSPPPYLSDADLQLRFDALVRDHRLVLAAPFESSSLLRPCWTAAVLRRLECHPFAEPEAQFWDAWYDEHGVVRTL
jgi:hypothetical protein